jgi:ketosteroid isomerase-like protein
MYHSLALVPVMAIGLAVPAVAQQLTDQAARQVVEAIVQAEYKAVQAKDAVAAAALGTDNVIRVTGAGDTIVGREAHVKWWAQVVQHWENDPDKIDQVRVLSNDMIVATGFWSGKWHGDNGSVPIAGRWMTSLLRVGDTWKQTMVLASDIPQK